MRWWPIAVPIVALSAAAGLLLVARGFGDARCARFTEVRWEELTRPGLCVRVAGMAHSAAAITSADGEIIVPLFPPGDIAGREVTIFVRSTRAPQPATIFANGDRIEVEITGGEEGVAPGQACVVYENADPRARVLGGGIIRTTVPMKLNAPLEAAE